ncbi:type III secretion system inner rod subunit SctI [Pseudomonas sp. MWU13-3659]|uniref:type III secretion system inner rod subunit SctI n=1 Tax=Pseudomonas sp. MWU13-3659 TaxID=2986964 RepID=UPI00256EEFBF|nr:type III secretion system inner rod subunit SctI [Pseudomonas sp. MWU13-3659]
MSRIAPAEEVIEASLESLNTPVADQHLVGEFERFLRPPMPVHEQDTSLLRQVGQIKEQFTEAKQSITAALAKGADDPATLMQLQWALTRINLQEELIAKTVGRTTQNIETLMKAQ